MVINLCDIFACAPGMMLGSSYITLMHQVTFQEMKNIVTAGSNVSLIILTAVITLITAAKHVTIAEVDFNVFVYVPCVYAVQHAQTGLGGRDVGAHLSHNTDQGHLADVGAFTPHIRTSDYHGSPAITL